MHHVVLDEWSRRDSFLHRRDPRAKAFAVLAFLVTVTTAHRQFLPLAGAYLFLLTGTLRLAGLPAGGALARAGVVLPFSLAFAAATALAGDYQRAGLLVGKSYLSALAVIALVGTTPMPRLLRGLEAAGVPRFLLMVAQFLYRYLFVISEEAQHMRIAATSRAGGRGPRVPRMRAAAGALAVLFARSYARAGEIHHAMLARGFQGHFRLVATLRFGAADAAFAAGAAALPIAIRLLVGAAG